MVEVYLKARLEYMTRPLAGTRAVAGGYLPRHRNEYDVALLIGERQSVYVRVFESGGIRIKRSDFFEFVHGREDNGE